MTLTMADAIYPADLPAGYDAYLGYVNGYWPTCQAIKAQFPAARFVCLSVAGPATPADGIDVESGNYTPAQGVAWMVQALAGRPPSRPVWYESVSQMDAAVAALAAAGISRPAVRLLSAHYGAGEHICGPATCNLTATPMDGTQWTDTAPGARGTMIDASILSDSFFTQGDPMAVTVQTDIHACQDCGALFNPNQQNFACPAHVTVVNGAVQVGVHNGVGSVGYLVLNDGTPVTG